MNTQEDILARLVEKFEQRYYGKYRGFVKNNKDPEKMGRLLVTVPSVLGKKVAVWAFPCVPYGGMKNRGLWFIPEKDAGVWVEFEEGDPEFPIWVGTFFSKPGDETEAPKSRKPDGKEDKVQSPPTSKMIKTEAGHTIQFEDKEGKERITIVEGKNSHVIAMDKDGVKITDGKNTHDITMDSSGIIIKCTDDNKIVMTSSGITIHGTKIKIGSDGAEEPLVLGNQFKSVVAQLVGMINGHQHAGNLGIPAPIMTAINWMVDPALSTNHKTE